MADDILLELKEDFKRDQMAQFMKKRGKLLVIAAILIVVFIAASEVWKGYDKKKRVEAGDKLYNVISSFNEVKDAKELQELQQNRSYREVAGLVEANFHEAKGNPEAMKEAYKKVANTAGANPTLRELAQINLASLALNANPADAEAEKQLKELSGPNKTFRFTAMEMLGAHYRHTGKLDEARAIYEKLSSDPQAPASLAGRARSMLSSF